MPDSLEPPPSRHKTTNSRSPVSHALVALLPAFACFLGGATQKWAEGIVVALLGLYLVLRPPRASLGLATNFVLAVFVALALVAFLPAHWFFFPAWRTALAEDFAIALPTTVSAQPWITLGAFASLVGGVCWLYLVATLDMELRSARFLLRLFVSSIVFLAAISILMYCAHLAFPFWINQRGFGPFPNRNQTGDLFGITAIVLLACAQDDIRHGRIRWVFALVGLGILTTAIILNYSRAGVAILVGGCALWIVAVALRQKSSARIALGVSFLLLLVSSILVLGGQTLDRFRQWGAAGTGISTDFRWRIFRDTFQLIRESPWCGIGLGNFDSVFAIFRNESAGQLRALHPESDWLWLWSEVGWPAVVLAVIGAILLMRKVLPLQEGTNQRFRLAALIGATIFAVHGLVDVSAHRVGTAYAGIFLLGLALHRPLCLNPSRSINIVFRIVGILLLTAGLSWVIGTRVKMLLPGIVGVSSAKELSTMANRGRNFGETIALTSRAIVWAPLDWQLYFFRGLAEVPANKPSDALDDFRRARFLEPNAYELPLAEGNAWLSSQPTLAATAWRDALRKAGQRRSEIYGSMLTNATMKNPQVGQILEEVGLSQSDLALAYLGRLSGPGFRRGVERLVRNDPNLGMLSETEKLAFFDLWSERGDLDELAKSIADHPDWLRYAWLGMAKYNAGKKDFHAAVELTQHFGEAVALPRASGEGSLAELQKRFYASPDNYTVGYALYRAQLQADRIDDALDTVRHFSERPSSPAYFHFLEAQCWASKQNWERSWTAWLSYRNAAKK
ncbi:MAG: hypothetical protein QOI34_1114 [Verrucomicrobiota bacterium]